MTVDELRATLSDAEREALRALWDHGPATVRQLCDLFNQHGHRWAYSTVATLLRRLESKGYAISELAASTLVYRSLLSREEVLSQRLKDTALELCNGAAAPLVLALVQGNRFSVQELERIQRIIDEARKEQERQIKRRK